MWTENARFASKTEESKTTDSCSFHSLSVSHSFSPSLSSSPTKKKKKKLIYRLFTRTERTPDYGGPCAAVSRFLSAVTASCRTGDDGDSSPASHAATVTLPSADTTFVVIDLDQLSKQKSSIDGLIDRVRVPAAP